VGTVPAAPMKLSSVSPENWLGSNDFRNSVSAARDYTAVSPISRMGNPMKTLTAMQAVWMATARHRLRRTGARSMCGSC
jgi:hypothetical protein